MRFRLLVVLSVCLLAGCASTQEASQDEGPGETKPVQKSQEGDEKETSAADEKGVREGKWEIRGTELFVRDVGPKDAPVLLVIHGGPGGNHRSLRPLQALTPDYRVVLFDQRGTGKSERLNVTPKKPESLRKLSLKQNVEDIEAIRKKLGKEKISIIGHSWGGTLATFYALAHPKNVEKLIVYSGGPETGELAKQKNEAHKSRLNEKEKAKLAEKKKALEKAIGNGATQEKLDEIFADMAAVMMPSLYCERPATIPEDIGRAGFWAGQVAKKYRKSFHYKAVADGLERIEAPTLLTWGSCEPSPRERLTNLLGHLPNARLVIFGESGHNAMEEQRDLFFRTIRAFLAGESLPMDTYTSKDELPDKNGDEES